MPLNDSRCLKAPWKSRKGIWTSPGGGWGPEGTAACKPEVAPNKAKGVLPAVDPPGHTALAVLPPPHPPHTVATAIRAPFHSSALALYLHRASSPQTPQHPTAKTLIQPQSSIFTVGLRARPCDSAPNSPAGRKRSAHLLPRASHWFLSIILSFPFMESLAVYRWSAQ